MLTRIKKSLHLNILMNLYSLSKAPTVNGAVWLKLNTSDLENIVRKTVGHKNLQLNGMNALDLGCRSGAVLSYLSREKKRIPYGVDLIRLNIYQCCKKIKSGHFFRQDINEYLDNTLMKFNLIILYWVIGCLPEFQQKEIIRKQLQLLSELPVTVLDLDYGQLSVKLTKHTVISGRIIQIHTQNDTKEMHYNSQCSINKLK